VLSWGLNPVKARFVVARSSHLARADTLERFYGADYSDVDVKYGAPWYMAHRADLHTALKDLAIDAQSPGRPVHIFTRSKVVEIDPDVGAITFANLSTVTADLVVAADGVHSGAAALVLGDDIPATPTGMSAFRWLLPHGDLLADPRTSHFLVNDEGRMKIFKGKEDHRLVWYPCRDNTIHNFALIHPDNSDKTVEDWNMPADKNMLLAELEAFHPDLVSVCEKAVEVKLWKLLYRPPIMRWHKDRLVLVGDAAHPMLPHQAQGGAQAIEDGAALEVAFSAFDSEKSLASLKQRLQLYEAIRKNRASAIQILSNAAQDQAERVHEAAKDYFPPGQVPSNPADFMDYNFRFDVYKTGTTLKKQMCI
jgi:salicylate hydroxylase